MWRHPVLLRRRRRQLKKRLRIFEVASQYFVTARMTATVFAQLLRTCLFRFHELKRADVVEIQLFVKKFASRSIFSRLDCVTASLLVVAGR